MPDFAELLVFLGTAAIFAITPGPGILYVLARSLRGGRGEGIRSVIGNGIGASVHVVAAALGLSALLATSAVAFAVVKYAGAAYLVFLGLQAIFQRHDDGGENGAARQWARSPLLQGVLTELLNPKTALYFMALLPHFVHPERAPAPLVFIVLGLIALALAMLADLLVAVFAGKLSSRLLGNARWRVRQRVASGATMVGLGGFVALAD
ncbi:Threonine/homoserine/homoserine lactone efflux protein [Amycolatopsis xylanica]|uniref:Threonine/homoserine/homoserine lactone efflux protein n=1 Tax=Amycolatopsis xylanica TaxID=589385 RepID=A0A1H3IWZ4_9PSEU|nr:LysE family translocator [Amycolatopsis xylanica]SDY32240.1 Threonine/homoserine/homoserine lactone efflux protein [Amycolatopsis xylanica]